ncbi:MAG: outer membrane beta-barrel domain-containing protein [Bdellovibrionales bacterium]|nr:outer membrane beta-barrel domain-containing protein [Bdellovibrionales bacterium]
MKLTRYVQCLLLICVLSQIPAALAQFDDAQEKKESSEVENLYDTFDKQEARRTRGKRIKQKEIPEPSRLADLATLEPFSDIAVIQRRFLPKTGRFEFSGSLMASVNNPFFSNLGFGARIAYYFNEKHGVVGQYYFLSNSERDVTSNLEQERGIETKSLTTPKNYAGLAYKWTPLYGKMTWLNRDIVPFDLFFTLGGGTTKTDLGNQEPTIHIGTGQVFAISKGMAVRWDLSWNFYQAEALDDNDETITNSQDDLFLMIGMSFFFPEATYR